MISTKILSIIIIAVLVEITVVSTSFYFGGLIIELEEKEILDKYSNNIILIVENIENQINSTIKVIDVTRELPQVKNTEYSDFISETLKGIPGDLDIEKRLVAKQILETYPDFEFITFHIPNGDFYIMEPYSDQLNVTRLNFADRDWYKGVLETQDTYVSEVYNSTTLKRNVVAIRTPVFDDGGNFIGIWGGSLKLQFMADAIRDINLAENSMITFYDQYGKMILSTEENMSQDFPSEIITKAIAGEKDIIITENPKMLVAYGPIKVGQVNWAIIATQPHADAFLSTTITKNLMIFMIVVIGIVLGAASYFMFSLTKKNLTLLEQLNKASIDKDEFSAMITHELKTPLVPIIGYTKMLTKKDMIGNLNAEQLNAVDTISRNAKRLEKLINDIMDARKLDMKKLKFVFATLSLDEFLSNIQSSYKDILTEQEIQFSVNNSSNNITIKTDEGRLRQVFNNLINNAIKFVPEGNGTIEIGAKKDGSVITFYVKDNGIGIPINKQKNIFKKFYQVDTSDRRASEGTGLGLAISKGIIENLGGKIWVESDGKTGTTFYFTVL